MATLSDWSLVKSHLKGHPAAMAHVDLAHLLATAKVARRRRTVCLRGLFRSSVARIARVAACSHRRMKEREKNRGGRTARGFSPPSLRLSALFTEQAAGCYETIGEARRRRRRHRRCRRRSRCLCARDTLAKFRRRCLPARINRFIYARRYNVYN